MQQHALRIVSSVVLSISLLFATLVVGTLSASAQDAGSMGLSVSPPNTEVSLLPGETISRTVTVRNSGTGTVTVSMTANNFLASGEDGSAAYLPIGSGGPADWIVMSPETFTLEQDESLDVTYTLSVPEDADAGGHYATIFAKALSMAAVEETGSTIGALVGANLLLNVSGEVVEQASIAEFSTERSRINAGEDIEFGVRITNDGNTHVIPEGVIEIYRKGTKVDEIPLNPQGAAVLPGSTRKFEITSSETILPGAYEAKVTMSYGSGQFLSAPEINFAVIGDNSLLNLTIGILIAVIAVLLVTLLTGRKKTEIK